MVVGITKSITLLARLEKMKKYRKNPTVLFQVRMSKDEMDRVVGEIEELGITRRQFLLLTYKLARQRRKVNKEQEAHTQSQQSFSF